MTDGLLSPEELARRYGAEAVSEHFELARQQNARHPLNYVNKTLREQYGDGQQAARQSQGPQKVICDACEIPRWLDDCAVRDGFAVCSRCYAICGPVDVRCPPRGRMSQAALRVQAYWEKDGPEENGPVRVRKP